MNTMLKVDLVSTRKAALVLRAINHKLRQQILSLLSQNTRMTVTEIYQALRLEQSVASQHLAILRRAGFVNTERDGKYIYYTINLDRLDEVSHLAAEIVK
jgi:DNA-binding transcriptional ArsR family regulator